MSKKTEAERDAERLFAGKTIKVEGERLNMRQLRALLLATAVADQWEITSSSNSAPNIRMLEQKGMVQTRKSHGSGLTFRPTAKGKRARERAWAAHVALVRLGA